MKQHILGLAIFSFIFASFAVVFAFFNTPSLPEIAEAEQNNNGKQPFFSYGNFCSRGSRKNLSVEVVNSELHFDKGRIISEVKLTWNGVDTPPKGIYLLTTVNSISAEKSVNSFDGVYRILKNPFENATEKTIKVVSRMSVNKQIKTEDNLSVIAIASEFTDDQTEETNKSYSERKEVVFVHGENSIIGN